MFNIEEVNKISATINKARELRAVAQKLGALAVDAPLVQFINELKAQRAALLMGTEATAEEAARTLDRAGYRDGYNGAEASGPQANTDQYLRAYVEGQKDRAADARRGVPIPFERP